MKNRYNGIEVVGAVWVLMVSALGARGGHGGRAWSGLSIATGAAGVATLLPSAADVAGALFGSA